MSEERIAVLGGKYTVILRENGTSTALRHGEQWPAYEGVNQLDNLTTALARDLRDARVEIERLKRRETDLLEANNRYLERARKAEWVGEVQHLELYVFRDTYQAQNSGFDTKTCAHPDANHLRCWWPELVTELLYNTPFIKVVEVMVENRRGYGDIVRQYLRSRMAPHGDKAVWVKLFS